MRMFGTILDMVTLALSVAVVSLMFCSSAHAQSKTGLVDWSGEDCPCPDGGRCTCANRVSWGHLSLGCHCGDYCICKDCPGKPSHKAKEEARIWAKEFVAELKAQAAKKQSAYQCETCSTYGQPMPYSPKQNYVPIYGSVYAYPTGGWRFGAGDTVPRVSWNGGAACAGGG